MLFTQIATSLNTGMLSPSTALLMLEALATIGLAASLTDEILHRTPPEQLSAFPTNLQEALAAHSPSQPQADSYLLSPPPSGDSSPLPRARWVSTQPAPA